MEFICSELLSGNSEIVRNVRWLFQYYEWCSIMRPELFSMEDCEIVSSKDFLKLQHLSTNALMYTQDMMIQFTEKLWQDNITNRFHLMGETQIPAVTCTRIPLPTGINRETEVKLLSFFYKQNLLNLFLSSAQKSLGISALCKCQKDVQDAFHLLTSCELVDADLREIINTEMARENMAGSIEEVTADYISILNSSRNVKFIEACIAIINRNKPELRTKFVINRT